MRVILSLLIASLGALITVNAAQVRPPASSQPHWAPRAVIGVWVDRQNLPRQGDELVERAMRSWTRAAGGAFTMQRTFAEADAGIRVYLNGAGGNYGVTRPRIDPASGFINAAIVAIAADAPIEVDDMTRQIIVYLTALHEIGHALGLEHTRNFDDIMYLFRQPDDGVRYFANYRRLLQSAGDIGEATASGLSAYDVETLRKLYTTN